MINSCYFPEDEDHVPLIERFKFLKILGKEYNLNNPSLPFHISLNIIFHRYKF